ncbi:MAG: LptF/LptG family permease [Pirellulaceae bacterium]|nr:LptF/LptG family permease [Pirellulaceae bacterium]
MIQRFNRYILWEITKLFSIALVAFTAIIMLGGLAQQLALEGLGTMAIVELLPYLLPIGLQFGLPPTLLFAVCSVYGRISADNEVVAIKAAGVNPIKIISPTLILAFLISLLAVWLNDIAFSWGAPGINRVVLLSLEEIVYGRLSKDNFYNTPSGFSIHVHGVGEDGRELISPTISFRPQAGDDPVTISARTGRLSMDAKGEVLQIILNDSQLEQGDLFINLPGENKWDIPLAQAARKGKATGQPSEYPMRLIGREIRQQQELLESTKEMIGTRTAFALVSGRYDWLDDTATHDKLGELYRGRERLQKLQVEPARRWASGFACFFFVWVGVPAAIWFRSADYWTTFGICFLPILLLYYPFFVYGLDRAKDGTWPAFSVWLGNLVMLAVGAWWLRKVYKS